ncbi:hypothetical protein GGI03_004062, partial [Coemansia sp. RSA 2337]
MTIGQGNTVAVDSPEHVSQLALPHNVAGFVRKLDLLVSMPFILNGTAYKLLSEYMGAIKTFPATNKLHIWATDCSVDSDYPKDIAVGNILEFAKLLKSLTPAETMTAVTCATN